MADNSFRNQREDAHARGGAAAQRDRFSDDPLAELARLIGQSDPQSPLGRLTSAAAEAPDEAAPPALDWSALEQDHGQQGHDLQQNFAASRPAAYQQFPVADASWRHDADGRDGAKPYSPPAALFEDALAAVHQEGDSYGGELGSGVTGSPVFPYIPPAHDDNASDNDGQYQAHDSSYAEAASDEYQGEWSDRRRRAAVVVVAVLGLVVVSTAGALGYHAMFGGSMIPSLPPIIKPGDAPVKIVPKKTASAGTSSPVVADAGASGDRLVSREEKPITIQSADPMPRVVTTIPVIANPADASSLPGAMPPAGVQQASAPTGPVPFDQFSGPASPPSGSKPVQTVVIKPVQSSPAKGPAAGPTSARAERSRPPSRIARQPQSRVASAAPLSIVPTQGGGAPAHTRTAMARGSAPTSSGPGSTQAMGGGYAVQVSSQRSEAAARAEFRALQAKFPQQLGQRGGMVRRANLGAKGTYYRVLVGPFASAGEASNLCGSLKAAGASCLVQRN